MRRLLLPFFMGLLACGGPADAPIPAMAVSGASSASVTGSPPPPASSVRPSPRYAALGPKALVRKATPTDLRKADEDACAQGKAEACRRMADRYRGYGAPAGCGVDRGRDRPFVKRVTEDSDADERSYTIAIGKACELGDEKACTLSKAAFASYTRSTWLAATNAMRSDPETLGILVFRQMATPEWTKVMLDQRNECLKTEWGCFGNQSIYYRHDVRPTDDPKLTPERAAIYVDTCKSTHDCDDLAMMLDKNRYAEADIAPIRAAFGATLTEACLAGECTCGHAVRFVAADDPKAIDLAILGCNDGEAEGCYELARRLEEGRGIEKDEKRALALYHLTCPDVWPRESEPGPRMGEYAKRSCDRLAEIASGGTYPPKDWDRAMYYASLACPSSGFEIDHAPCVRKGRFFTSNPKSTGRNDEDARDFAYGQVGDPVLRHECQRPSVKAECDAFDKSLADVK